jgi:hypothetical protein
MTEEKVRIVSAALREILQCNGPAAQNAEQH